VWVGQAERLIISRLEGSPRPLLPPAAAVRISLSTHHCCTPKSLAMRRVAALKPR
jgi:hypothetical protein